MCLKCIRLVKPVQLRQPAQVRNLAERLESYIAKGTLKIVQATAPIEELRHQTLLQDNYFFVLHCTRCGREFQLSMDFYRGRGTWR